MPMTRRGPFLFRGLSRQRDRWQGLANTWTSHVRVCLHIVEIPTVGISQPL